MTDGKFESARHIYHEHGFVYTAWRACEYITSPPLEYLFAFLRGDFESTVQFNIQFERQLWLYRHGFRRQSDALYRLDRYGPGAYLSDVARLSRARAINKPFDDTLTNKLTFYQTITEFTDSMPALYGLLLDGEFHALPAAAPTDAESIADLLREYEQMVIKPVAGSRGKDVMLCAWLSDGVLVNGEPVSTAAFSERIADLDDFIVTEYIDQDGYASELYPDTPNTIRILTMVDPDINEPFIGAAVHRIGTADSGAVDNWSQGGLSAAISENGMLSAGVQFPKIGGLEWHQKHPDTGAQIAGRAVPNWETITDEILDLAVALPHIPYIGWDVLPTADGYYIIEGNTNTDVDLLQVHDPLLTDARVRRFYEYHGVI